jgi:hypothetical protein
LTGACRCEVPSRESPDAASAASASVGTFEGPAPKRPSAGFRASGMVIVSVTVAYLVAIAGSDLVVEVSVLWS